MSCPIWYLSYGESHKIITQLNIRPKPSQARHFYFFKTTLCLVQCEMLRVSKLGRYLQQKQLVLCKARSKAEQSKAKQSKAKQSRAELSRRVR